MTADQVIAKLRQHESELKAADVVRLSLFGSTARGDRREDSDIDLLAAFDGTRRLSLLGLAGIEIRLTELLGQAVDLVEEGTLKPRVQKSVETEALRAFYNKDPAQRFEDILQNITHIEEFTRGMDLTTFSGRSQDHQCRGALSRTDQRRRQEARCHSRGAVSRNSVGPTASRGQFPAA